MKPIRIRHTLATLALALPLVGCGALQSQNPGTALQPVNAVATPEDDRVLLRGADVVAYFTAGAYQQGRADIQARHQGVSFYFANADHKALFEKSPERYLPQFGGYCANGIAYGIPWGGDADSWKVIDGKLYIFGGQASREAFELNEKANLTLAERYWQQEIQGHNSFVQRVKRLVFKVPHYKTGEELAREVAQARAR